MPKPLMLRFQQKVRVSREHFYEGTPCHDWQGSISKGYGNLRGDKSEGGRVLKAHRVSHELFIGPIVDDNVVDHRCVRRCCVNPLHLEQVTQAENTRRGWQTSRRPMSDLTEEF